MGKSIGEIAPYALGAAALIASGGTAAPALAGAAGAGAAGAGAAGAGAAAAGAGAATAGGLGLAGNALAAQGAAGLLGGAGATAAGYGALGSGLGTAAATEAAAASLPDGLATFGPNNEYIGSTIANDGMTANSFTGGYDQLNGLERIGQRVSGIDLNGNGIKTAQKGLGLLQGGGEQQQPQQAPIGAIQPRQPQQMAGSFQDSSNLSPLELDELKKRQWLTGLGNPNA